MVSFYGSYSSATTLRLAGVVNFVMGCSSFSLSECSDFHVNSVLCVCVCCLCSSGVAAI